MSAAKAAYYSNFISNNRHNPRLLFDTVSRLSQRVQAVSDTDLSAHDFFYCILMKGSRTLETKYPCLTVTKQSDLKLIPPHWSLSSMLQNYCG